jgi:hypothetical protein
MEPPRVRRSNIYKTKAGNMNPAYTSSDRQDSPCDRAHRPQLHKQPQSFSSSLHLPIFLTRILTLDHTKSRQHGLVLAELALAAPNEANESCIRDEFPGPGWRCSIRVYKGGRRSLAGQGDSLYGQQGRPGRDDGPTAVSCPTKSCVATMPVLSLCLYVESKWSE